MGQSLTKNSFLQINATIVAGLLIFLTIQSVATDSLFDLWYKYELTLSEDKVLTNLQNNITESKKIYENKDEGGAVIIQPDSKDGELSFSIPPPLSELERKESLVNQMSDENLKEQIKLQAKLDIRNKLPLPLYLYSNPQFVIAILIIPFVTSMLVELASWARNINNETPNILAYGFFVAGLVIMLGIFGINLWIYSLKP